MADPDPYRRTARYYDRFIEPLNSGVRDVVFRFDPPRAGWSVLDVGCGTGTALHRYGEAGCELFGVDVSPAMIEQARAKLGDRAELHLATDGSLPFPDDNFDRVAVSMVLHEIPDEERDVAIAEMMRVKKPAGRLVVTDYRFGSLRGVKGPLVKALSMTVERLSSHHSGYRSFRRSGGIPGLLERNGVAIEREKIVAGGNLAIYLAGDPG